LHGTQAAEKRCFEAVIDNTRALEALCAASGFVTPDPATRDDALAHFADLTDENSEVHMARAVARLRS